MAEMLKYKLGLLPATKSPELKLGSYLDTTQLPPLPAVFGHHTKIPPEAWGLLGNDQVGDCTIAGVEHIEMIWNSMVGTEVVFSTGTALQDYSSVTGYTPTDPNTDVGSDSVTVAEYWKETGLIDTRGKRHQLAAYLSVNTSMLDHLYYSCWLFGATGLGVGLPASAEAQFMNNKPWTVMPGDEIVGGHYIPLVGRDEKQLYIVTWGRLQAVTEEWLTTYISEAVAYLSQEDLTDGKSPEGFNYAELVADLRHVGSNS